MRTSRAHGKCFGLDFTCNRWSTLDYRIVQKIFKEMKSLLLALASMLVIGCNWGNSGCCDCACGADCCSSDKCPVADCDCKCNN